MRDTVAYCRLEGILFSLLYWVVLCSVFLVKSGIWMQSDIYYSSIFSVLYMHYVLPSMHERYGFYATILLLLYYILYREVGK